MVSVQESAEHLEFFHQDKLVARHPKACVWRIVDFARISNSPHTGSLMGSKVGRRSV
jgi:hypothetical protein